MDRTGHWVVAGPGSCGQAILTSHPCPPRCGTGATEVWRPATPTAYYETHLAGDDDWDWRWEAFDHVASGLCVDVQSGQATAGGTLQLYDCNGGVAQTFNVVEYFEEADGRLSISVPRGPLRLRRHPDLERPRRHRRGRRQRGPLRGRPPGREKAATRGQRLLSRSLAPRFG